MTSSSVRLLPGKKSAAKIDTDLDFGHEHWKGRGDIEENVRKKRPEKKFVQM